MKMSFSLSSLRQNSSDSLERMEQQQKRAIRMERPYNSLTKKRKEPMQDHSSSKNWSGPEDNKDDFWAAIRTNYDYIMDTDLIDTCKEANGELSWDEGDVSTVSWGLKEVSCQFSELYSWLRVLQELVYSKEENLLDKSLRAAHTEELRKKAYRRRLFNEQAEKLIARAPSLKDEVSWRLDHLNAKWDLVEQIMAPVERPEEDNQDVTADFEHEVKCLRKWLREMETRLQPLNFKVDWSRAEIEEKAMEHMVLQKDIESHGRIVSSVVKLGERISEEQDQNNEERQQRQEAALRVASSLERRWHLLFLRSLEWQCHIEALAARVRTKSVATSRCSSDSDDEEPVTKHPRLSRNRALSSCSLPSKSTIVVNNSETSGGTIPVRRSARLSVKLRRRRASNSEESTKETGLSDSDVYSEKHFLDYGSYFEDDLDNLCATNTTKQQFVKSSSFSDQGSEGDVEEGGGLSEEEESKEMKIMAPTVDNNSIMVPTTKTTSIDVDEIDGKGLTRNNSPASNDSNPKRRKTEIDETALFNTSNRKSKNCATFYFKHRDTDSEADINNPERERNVLITIAATGEEKSSEESSEEEWTYTSGMLDISSVSTQQRVRLNFNSSSNDDEINGNSSDKNNASIPMDNQSLFKDASDDEEYKADRASIQRLISEVEKLVREEDRSSQVSKLVIHDRSLPTTTCISQSHTRAKYARIKEWLALNSIRCREGCYAPQHYQQIISSEALDSCDASGEYTTGESDVEKQSETSEDFQSSIATYRRLDNNNAGSVSQSTSEEILESDNVTEKSKFGPNECSTPKVQLRTKTSKCSNGPRPWSVSCITQIGKRGSLGDNTQPPISQFSISETALHQLVSTTPVKVAAESSDTTESRVPFNNSTTTLLEETIIGHDARVARNSSLRRRKNRLRKKNVGRKSESGSDGVNVNHRSDNSDSSNFQRSTRKSTSSRQTRSSRDSHLSTCGLVKSGSFSGRSDDQNDKTILANDSSAVPQIKINSKSTSVSDSEDDGSQRRNKGGNSREEIVAKEKQGQSTQFNADSDIEMNSLSNNSFSEHATWDNYQEKYNSEAYSETQDVETARRLLDFGDDYRNFLDSQSDYASSLSAVYHRSNVTSEDSDSDNEFKRLAATSQSQLLFSENHYGSMSDHSFNELTRVCRENIRCLRAMSEASGSRHRDKHSKQIRGLMERWESLSLRAEEAQKINNIHREMSAMKLEFCAAHERIMSYEVVLEEPHVIDERIARITNELANLRDRKPAMVALNASTNRLIAELGQRTSPTSTALKDGVADLYRIWDEANQKGNQQLCALQAVQQFGTRLTELKSALSRDKDTLAVLDAALEAGATMEVASSVRDVARLLSEKPDTGNQTDSSLDTSIDSSGNTTQKFNEITLIGLEGGSLSDSGISDSGSEQELSERERRLAALRRLTRSLENQLEPGSESLRVLWKRVEEAEAELRLLQEQCRNLIIRTATSVNNPPTGKVKSEVLNVLKNSKMPKEEEIEKKSSTGITAPGSPDSEPESTRSWVWRILRAALPFQLALVVLLCAACLLEPSCCDVSNTLNLSLTPQLRYVRGPPPV